jgi:sec-independent protein translocase protein TatA
MFGFSTPALILIAVIALVVLGPGKLPELGTALGKAINGFRKGADQSPEITDKDKEQKKNEA